MGWFEGHPVITGYLMVAAVWGVWQIVRSPFKPRIGSSVATLILAPILMPLSILKSRSSDARWKDLHWKCPNCAWAMFEEECERCGAIGLPYDPVSHQVVVEARDGILVRPAHPDEAATLSALAMRSKAHWGYDEAFLEACRPELTLSPQDVTASRVVVAELDGTLAGFVALAGWPPEGELTHLFVDPPCMGVGVGRALFSNAVDTARRDHFRTFAIESDPGAEAFYLRMGARRDGMIASGSIPGRTIPRLRFDLD